MIQSGFSANPFGVFSVHVELGMSGLFLGIGNAESKLCGFNGMEGMSARSKVSAAQQSSLPPS